MIAFVSSMVLCIVIVSLVQNIREIDSSSEYRWIEFAGYVGLLGLAVYLLGKLP